MTLARTPASGPLPSTGGKDALLARALDRAQEAVFGVLPAGRFFYANESACRTLGYSRAELLTMGVYDIDPGFPADRWPGHWEECRRRGGLTFETIQRRKDGAEVAVEVRNGILLEVGQERMFAYVRDLTARKSAEEAARSSEAKFQRAFQVIPDAISISRLADGTYLEVGEGFTRIFGWSQEAALGRTSLDLGIWAWPADRDRLVAAVKGSDASTGLEFTLRRKDGVPFTGMISGKLVEMNGEPCLLAVTRDITERKRMEETLRDSEARYRALFQTMAQGVVYQDAAGRIISANPAAERILGMGADQLLAHTAADPAWRTIRHDGSDFPTREHPAMVALRTGSPVLDVVMGVTQPGEEPQRWVLVSAVPQFREGETGPFQVYTTLTDITEQRWIQEELQTAERRLHTVVSNSQAVIYQLDAHGLFTLSEGRGLEGLGLRPGEVVGMSAMEVYAGHPQIPDQVRRALNGEPVRDITEVGGMTFDHFLSPVLDNRGRVESVIGIATDITARKLAEDALRDSEARFRAIFEYEPECVKLVAEDGTLLDMNPAGLAMIEVEDRSQAVGGNVLDIIGREWRDAFKRMLERVFRGETVQGEFEIVGVRGTHRLMETHAVPLRRPDFKVTSMLAVTRDITARKQAENELRASEARYRSLYEKTPVMLHSIERSGHLISVSDLWLSRMGYTRDEVLGRRATEFMTQQSAKFALESVFPTFFKTGTCSNVPYQFVTKAGAIIEILLSATAERDATGEVQNSLAVLVDVTEQKRALDALRRSEAKLGALFQSMTEGVALHELVYDESGSPSDYRILDANPAFESHLGISVSRARGALASELYGLGRPPYLDIYSDVARNGRATTFETYFPPLDRHLRIGAVPLDRDHFASIFEDVTEQIQSLEALRQSEASYRGLFDGVHEAIYIQDLSGRFLDVNRCAREMYGYSREDFIGRTPEFLSAPGMNDLAEIGECVRRAFAGEPQQFEFWGLRKNGETFPKEVRVYPGTYFGQEVVVALSIDISERRRSEEALRQAQKLESLGVLAGGIAHDFNNLLTAMVGNLNLAQMHLPDASPAQPYLDAVERTVLKASDLTKQMLAYSGKGRFVVKAQDLNAIVKEMVHLLQVSISKKADLRLELEEELPAIQAEAAQVQQVVMNLVTNASDALSARQGIIRVATSLQRLDATAISRQFPNQTLDPGEFVVLEVADTGCGISEEVMSRIFDPFFTTKTAGRGLGLSALLGILRGHKAGIRIRSEPGKGSLFEVFFPASGEAAAEVRAGSPDRAGSISGTVLLVDDEEMILESTGAALATLGLEVVTARDGVDGLARFLELGPRLSLVLMDLSMPRMDGVTAFLAMHQAHPEVPVLLSSGYDPQEPGEGLLDKGLAGFIQKPYRLKDLAAAVVAAMAKKPTL